MPPSAHFPTASLGTVLVWLIAVTALIVALLAFNRTLYSEQVVVSPSPSPTPTPPPSPTPAPETNLTLPDLYAYEGWSSNLTCLGNIYLFKNGTHGEHDCIHTSEMEFPMGGDLDGTTASATLKPTNLPAGDYCTGPNEHVKSVTTIGGGRVDGVTCETLEPGAGIVLAGDVVGPINDTVIVGTGFPAGSHCNASYLPGTIVVNNQSQIVSIECVSVSETALNASAVGGDLEGFLPNPTLVPTGVVPACRDFGGDFVCFDAKGRIINWTDTGDEYVVVGDTIVSTTLTGTYGGTLNIIDSGVTPGCYIFGAYNTCITGKGTTSSVTPTGDSVAYTTTTITSSTTIDGTVGAPEMKVITTAGSFGAGNKLITLSRDVYGRLTATADGPEALIVTTSFATSGYFTGTAATIKPVARLPNPGVTRFGGTNCWPVFDALQEGIITDYIGCQTVSLTGLSNGTLTLVGTPNQIYVNETEENVYTFTTPQDLHYGANVYFHSGRFLPTGNTQTFDSPMEGLLIVGTTARGSFIRLGTDASDTPIAEMTTPSASEFRIVWNAYTGSTNGEMVHGADSDRVRYVRMKDGVFSVGGTSVAGTPGSTTYTDGDLVDRFTVDDTVTRSYQSIDIQATSPVLQFTASATPSCAVREDWATANNHHIVFDGKFTGSGFAGGPSTSARTMGITKQASTITFWARSDTSPFTGCGSISSLASLFIVAYDATTSHITADTTLARFYGQTLMGPDLGIQGTPRVTITGESSGDALPVVQFHMSGSARPGLQLGMISATRSVLAFGAYYTGSAFMATTSGTTLVMDYQEDGISFKLNSGTTPGSTFTPSELVKFTTTGHTMRPSLAILGTESEPSKFVMTGRAAQSTSSPTFSVVTGNVFSLDFASVNFGMADPLAGTLSTSDHGYSLFYNQGRIEFRGYTASGVSSNVGVFDTSGTTFYKNLNVAADSSNFAAFTLKSVSSASYPHINIGSSSNSAAWIGFGVTRDSSGTYRRSTTNWGFASVWTGSTLDFNSFTSGTTGGVVTPTLQLRITAANVRIPLGLHLGPMPGTTDTVAKYAVAGPGGASDDDQSLLQFFRTSSSPYIQIGITPGGNPTVNFGAYFAAGNYHSIDSAAAFLLYRHGAGYLRVAGSVPTAAGMAGTMAVTTLADFTTTGLILYTPLAVSSGGTGSSATLAGGRVMVSSGQTIVESSATTADVVPVEEPWTSYTMATGGILWVKLKRVGNTVFVEITSQGLVTWPPGGYGTTSTAIPVSYRPAFDFPRLTFWTETIDINAEIGINTSGTIFVRRTSTSGTTFQLWRVSFHYELGARPF